MTRILSWNINNFSQTKIANTVVGNDRLAHIINEVFLPQVPDIFVVIEVFARTRDVGMEGVPIVGGARQGAIQLLGDIQNATGNNNWMLVPPVWSGSFGFGEGIAVYYDSGNLQFVGPYVYGPDYTTATRTPPIERACPLANTNRPAGRPPAWLNGPQLYPGTLGNCLPNRASPGGLPNENRLAGKYEFFDLGGARINFPSGFHRSPFQTNFIDLTMAAPRRTIKVFSVHTSPGFARAGVQRLSTVPDIVPAAGEVSVLLGDFNVDTFDSRAAYNVLTGANFTIAFDSINAGAIRATRMPYCLTHLLPTARAMPYGTSGGAVAADPQHNVYPRFGYMGSMGGFLFQTPVDAGAIDNFFTQYNGAVAGGPAANASIINTVVGKPYNALAPAPANVTAALTGGLAYAQRLNTAIPLPAGRDSTLAAPTPANDLTTFQQWNNFDRIHSTSDHLPLVIEV